MKIQKKDQDRIIILCNTPYQLIVAIELKITLYRKKKADIIITSIMNGSDEIASGLIKTNLFENVFYINKDFNHLRKKKYKLNNIFVKEMRRFLNDFKLINKKNRYSEYLFANIGGIGVYIGNYLLNINSNIKLSMYEDGLSSYSRIYEKEINKRINCKNILKRVYYKVSLDLFSKIDKYYLFNPDFIIWECSYDIRKIPAISENLSEIGKIFDTIFDLSEITNSYNESNIFFEESYYSDGYDVNDIDLINNISKYCGKDNIFIKKHPRNQENRFGKLGYKTNNIQDVPWEVLAFKFYINNKTLISISSTAVINTYLFLGNKAKIILLYKCTDLDNERFNMTKEVIDQITHIYPTSFLVPDSEEQLKDFIMNN